MPQISTNIEVHKYIKEAKCIFNVQNTSPYDAVNPNKVPEIILQ